MSFPLDIISLFLRSDRKMIDGFVDIHHIMLQLVGMVMINFNQLEHMEVTQLQEFGFLL